MKVSLDAIKDLRAQTGASLADIKFALEQAEGDYEKALKVLADKGLASAGKRMDRETGQGIVYSYVHNNRIGVLLELNCETDFVARNPDFEEMAKNLAIQIVLNDAKYVNESEMTDTSEKDSVLLSQDYYKDSSMTVEDFIKLGISKFGENIRLRRFYKMILGK
jgi:elongation factor Ts